MSEGRGYWFAQPIDCISPECKKNIFCIEEFILNNNYFENRPTLISDIVKWWFMLLLKPWAHGISTFFKESCLTAEFLMKTTLRHDSAAIKELRQAKHAKEHFPLFSQTTYFALKYWFPIYNQYFLINICYIVPLFLIRCHSQCFMGL